MKGSFIIPSVRKDPFIAPRRSNREPPAAWHAAGLCRSGKFACHRRGFRVIVGGVENSFWDERYRLPRPARVNVVVATTVEDVAPGTALDLGRGGGDALWPAERGWRVSAVDSAGTAVRKRAVA